MKAVSKITFKEAFNIPNILCYIRILLIPVFSYILLTTQTQQGKYTAAALIFLSGLTDLLDGFIARRFKMITELGKLLDPIADKLTQFMVALCLILTIKHMVVLVLIVFVKEISQGICCLILLKKDQKLDGAKWFGKVSTAIFYAVIVALLIFELRSIFQTFLIAIASGFMILSLVLYIIEFLQMGKKSKLLS